MRMQDLTGRVAVVTGASSGTGHARCDGNVIVPDAPREREQHRQDAKP